MLSVYILILFFALRDAALIKFVKFNSNVIEFQNNTVNSENLQVFNEELLGVRAPKKSNKNSLLFRRPNALVILDIHGLETVNIRGEDFVFDGEFTTDPLLEKMQNVLNKDQLKVLTIDAHGNLNGKSENLIGYINGKNINKGSSKSQAMDNQLAAVNKLEMALKTFKKEDNIIQVYHISLNVPAQSIDQEKETDNEKLLQTGLENIINSLHKVYGNQLVVEIHSKTSDEAQTQQIYQRLKNIRSTYQVAAMAHQDYPAMFLIVSTVIVVFSFTILATVISFWDNQDMGKNSIIYRLTNNRKKKD